ncbi:tol-pal system protein YbgF [Rhodoblastus sp. 17X3]|uniref:tol-pal system protein YbgF n=1 Tax=Rhodoblastus sp. 17X3 TaxID=3047026 RepID=UPI0024B7E492|nr:tol-pal system protein YbgF [Rhodoblastus sp. 17X3]MDI9848017.1 tol-pal system protein YbgF [Rhodoblastus sp. 17X3]
MAILSPGVLSVTGSCFSGLRKTLFTAVAATALVAGPGAARAQFFDRPAAREQPAESAPGADTSSILRIDRLESQVRSLNGQVEQLQFQVKRMEDQLRKFQLDVDARFQDGAGGGAAIPGAAKPTTPAARPAAATTPQRRSDLPDGLNAAAPAPSVADISPVIDAQEAPAAVAAAPVAEPVTVSPDGRKHDAFDPSARPDAPGAPLALGSPESASKPQVRASESRAAAAATGPLDLTPPGLRSSAASESGAAPASVATLAPSAPAPNGAALAPGASADPVKLEYESAAEQLKSQHYDAAQRAFSAFVQKNPHNRLIAPAIYHLGESFYYQNRHREAAEQFLKIATDFSKSPVAPDAMVKLGVSLNALGAKEQACAFFSEVPRKYPNAATAQKLAAEREAKKASC